MIRTPATRPTPVTVDGTEIGAITRTHNGWEGWIRAADGAGYLPIGYGNQDVATPYEAREAVIAEHELRTRLA